MSKRVQERKKGEELVVAKPWSVKISRSLSANQSRTFDSGTSYSRVNCRFGWQSELTSTGKSVQDTVENSASSSQV